MAAALASALTGRRVRPDVAMTGEITLSGQVLPVGGIREKVLAARRSGIRHVALPEMNEVNVVQDLPAEIRAEMTFRYLQTMGEALDFALSQEVARPERHPRGAEARPDGGAATSH
jgi:ATP-dependent Lon protease